MVAGRGRAGFVTQFNCVIRAAAFRAFRNADMIFPLPLVAFEHYLMADDRPSHPMVCHFRLQFDGELDREALGRSVDAATARHPLLRAVVQTKGRKSQFVAADIQRPEILWQSDPDRDVVASAEPLDVHKEVGLRITVCQGDGRATIWLAVHHVCCDGMGAMRFIEDLLIAYANETTAANIPLPALDEKQLLDRGVFASSRLIQWLRWPWEMLCMIGSLEYFTHRPLPLRAKGGDAGVGRAGPSVAMCRRRLDATQSRQLLQAARDEQVTLNDLLMRDLFVSAQGWLSAHATESTEAQGHIRIMVPINLRTRLHDAMPAANGVGMINIERRVYRWHDPRQMLRVLAREMRIVKRLRVTTTMLRIVSMVRLLTGSLRRLQPTDRCLSTCLFSNMGILFRDSALADAAGYVKVGDVTLEHIEAVPPIRPWTGAGFCVSSYARQLTVSLLYDTQLLGPTGGEELLDRLVSQLENSAQGDRRPAASSEGGPGEAISEEAASGAELSRDGTRSASEPAGEPIN